MNNVKELKPINNVKEVLENCLKDADNLLGVIVIRIDSKHQASTVFSDLTAYQISYAKWRFDSIADKLLTASLNQPDMIS